MSRRCYYDNQLCDYIEGLWKCLTCGEMFCHFHNHVTSKGENVECVGCERIRLENEK